MTWSVHTADCLEFMRTLPDGSVDAVVTDPPYFLPAAHYCTRKQFRRSLSGLSMLEHFFRDWFSECSRILKPTGCYYVFCDGQSYPVFYALGYEACKRIVPLVWDKQVSINGYSWRHQHELILFGEKEKYPAVPTGDGDILKCRAVPVDDRLHPAEKPVSLLKSLITKSVTEGGMVLDCFLGGGATGVACIQTGRNFIGTEIDPTYADIARRRCREAEENVALLAGGVK